MMRALRQVQERLKLVTQAADKRTRELLAKIGELEAQNLTTMLQNRQLEAETAELLGRVEVSMAELAEHLYSRRRTLLTGSCIQGPRA